LKNKSLNFKLILTFFSVLVIFSGITYSLLIKSFQNYYEEDIYRVIEDNLNIKLNQPFTNIDDFINEFEDENDRSIGQLFWIMKDGKFFRKEKISSNDLTEDILDNIESDILNQTKKMKRYSIDVNGRKLFYVVTKYDFPKIIRPKVTNQTINNTNLRPRVNVQNVVYQVGLRWEPIDDTLEKQLFSQIGIGILLTIVAMLVVLFFLSTHLTKPLMKLTKSVKQISKRKFDKPITINRNDEIGFLADTIEEMRKELLSYDQEQKLKLHSISHELKTPIMIIQSYIEALKKEIYPKGSPESSLQVIEDECNRLQKLVYNLLYIQRLDYFESEIKNKEKINLQEVIEEVIYNMEIELNNFKTEYHLENVYLQVDYNQMKIIVENILSNQIRYANSFIRITLKKEDDGVILTFYNDGEQLDENVDIFKMFKKGKNGQSGLGLYIVKRLLDINNGSISAYNEEKGVSFKILLK
jgi:two-component system sensor histidine kinase CssS